MTGPTKIIILILAFIAPFVALKIMGRPIIIETKLKLKTEKQTGNCLPLTTTSLVEQNLFIEKPAMGFAISTAGALQQLGWLDLIFKDFPEGRVNIDPGKPVRTCLQFRSNEKLDIIRRRAASLPKHMMIECKLGVLMGTPDQNYTRLYAIVFPCQRYLENFQREYR